jgi:hypothetical protein
VIPLASRSPLAAIVHKLQKVERMADVEEIKLNYRLAA